MHHYIHACYLGQRVFFTTPPKVSTQAHWCCFGKILHIKIPPYYNYLHKTCSLFMILVVVPSV